ncbi:hypothetical protein D5Z33_23580, partial [Escherichia coli]|nr:hypothetical protein [Escherichia coli]
MTVFLSPLRKTQSRSHFCHFFLILHRIIVSVCFLSGVNFSTDIPFTLIYTGYPTRRICSTGRITYWRTEICCLVWFPVSAHLSSALSLRWHAIFPSSPAFVFF